MRSAGAAVTGVGYGLLAMFHVKQRARREALRACEARL